MAHPRKDAAAEVVVPGPEPHQVSCAESVHSILVSSSWTANTRWNSLPLESQCLEAKTRWPNV